MSERFALLYSDGSNTILPEGTTEADAIDECKTIDEGENDRSMLTKVALVEYALLRVLFDPTASAAVTA